MAPNRLEVPYYFFFLNCGVLPKIFLDRQNSHFNTSPKFFLIFFREFQLMASVTDDNYLSSDQDINQFLV